jgi:hypothetical protein
MDLAALHTADHLCATPKAATARCSRVAITLVVRSRPRGPARPGAAIC